MFAESSSLATDKFGILFIMTIDPTLKSTPFADIVGQSYFEEEAEILFSMHSVFRVDHVDEGVDGNGRLFEVRLTLTADHDPQLKLLRESMAEEVKGSTAWDRLGCLLIMVKQLDKAEVLYNRLLPQDQDGDDIAYCNSQLGSIKHGQGDYQEALSYYEKCLDIEEETLPADHPSVATSYNNIGSVYLSMGQYHNALSYYEKSLNIRQKTLSANDPDVTTSYNNMGSVYRSVGKYSKALFYFEKCLAIEQKTLPADHPSLATSYNNIGSVYCSLGEYSKALPLFQRALKSWQRALPLNHPNIQTALSSIAVVKKKL